MTGATRIELLVGCPVWDRAWCMDLWFDSVEANVDPATTGLAFVIPAEDDATRETISRRGGRFAWVELLRDRHPQYRDRSDVRRHGTLAAARNALLGLAARIRPRRFISWDSDLLVAEGTVEAILRAGKPVTTAWTWLNRQPPKRLYHESADGQRREVEMQVPPACTAMAWDPAAKGRALHYPAKSFTLRSHGVWRTDVVLGFQVMAPPAYLSCHYAPHPDGEDLPLNLQMEARGIERWCYGERVGVHLYRREAGEADMGWPGVMDLAAEVPLAASWRGERDVDLQVLGLYPVQPVLTGGIGGP